MQWRKLLAVFVFSALTLSAATYTPGEIRTNGFFDDTLQLTYGAGLSATSAIIGLCNNHPNGPDQALWQTFFYKIKPDTMSRFADSDVKFWIQEVDFFKPLGDTVYTALADTSADTLTTTGVAADTSWTKIAFASNPCNGYRIMLSAQSACSTPAKAKFWFHLRKKIGVVN